MRKNSTSKPQPGGAELGKRFFFVLIRKESEKGRGVKLGVVYTSTTHRLRVSTWMLNYNRGAGLKSVYISRNDILTNIPQWTYTIINLLK